MKTSMLGAAVVAGAMVLSTAALAKPKFEYSGTVAAGEVVELEFEHAWYHNAIGQVTFYGGSLDFARMDSQATFLYSIAHPRETISVDMSSFCMSTVDLPCSQLQNFTSTSFRFYTPSFFRGNPGDNYQTDPTPLPKGRYLTTGNRTTSQLRFIFDGDEPIHYSVKGFTSAPEPTTWALLVGGFGLAGGMLRKRRALAWPRLGQARLGWSRRS